jgi:hypothetical protein
MTPETVTLSLVSHTNVGKTSLARTLLRRDVGEVRDEAHTTDLSEAYELIAAGPARLRLYDTPGLGDTARLLARLRHEANPLGWLLGQVWDRFANRPLWCTQQAIRATRDEADAVLYLVNASEAPEDAGYVRHELDLLTWIGRPALVLLNQTGPARPRDESVPPGEAPAALEARWAAYTRRWAVVRDVLSLDAFSRCWVQEGVLFEHIAALLPEAKQPAMRACLAAWEGRNRTVFQESVARQAAYLAAVAADRELLAPPADGGLVAGLRLDVRGRSRAMQALRGRLETATRRLVDELIALHGLDGHSTVQLKQRLDDFSLTGASWLTPTRGAAVGSVVSGALGGLAADLLVGGLSFGSGAVAGAVLGALGGAGLSQAFRLATGAEAPAVAFAPAFLHDLARQTLLRYLAVAHFGRGRGGYTDVELPPEWRGLADRALAPLDPLLAAALARDPVARAEAARRLEAALSAGLRAVLVLSYPEAARVLAEAVGPGTPAGDRRP